ncbi:MAG: hypothetical protein KGJ50_10390 [Xanthomonadaceae bacterium]|nr:hypothetical protein [Xanthomonadaceae bacterium]MDE2246255.1 hypothetical protein [Xanthomonadaceae bacterium]
MLARFAEAAMRSLILLVLGIAIGAIAALQVSTAWRQRDAYPRGVMAVMQHHLGALHQAVVAKQCPLAQSALHLDWLQRMAGTIPDALPQYGHDAHFQDFVHRLQGEIRRTQSPLPGTCGALEPRIRAIGGACEACHAEYR